MKKRFLIYGLTGIIMETLWTGLNSLVYGNMSLMTHTSLWMIVIYGLMVFNEPVFKVFKPKPFYIRGIIYMLVIFSAEYLSGHILKSLNICPWDYSDLSHNINGLVLPAYAPLWFCAGLFYERLFFYLKKTK
ncbi:MAG: putative ABC transporter permease [Clostridiales bacterium]|uniref:putative ABC transporter permease n=1 Tax=Cloacibacillus porcorum TaxID=1197717 RepID=UPI003C6BD9CA|nr:putative ABC transporter permease [Clostridiales bacterium]